MQQVDHGIYIYLSYCHISERSPTSARPFLKFRIQSPRFVGAGDMVNGPLIVPTPTPSAWALNGAQAPAGWDAGMMLEPAEISWIKSMNMDNMDV